MLIDWVRSGRTGKYLARGQGARTERSVNKYIQQCSLEPEVNKEHRRNCSCGNTYVAVVLIIGLFVHRFSINLLIEFASKIKERNTTKFKFIRYLCFVLAWVWWKINLGQSIWPAGNRRNLCVYWRFLKASNMSSWKDLWSKSHPFNYPGLGVMSFEYREISFSNYPSCLLAEMSLVAKF